MNDFMDAVDGWMTDGRSRATTKTTETTKGGATQDFGRFGRFGRSPGWPAPLAEVAFHGLPGEFVRLVEPHSEADPAALLISTLVSLGAVIGRYPGFRAEGDFHSTVLYAIVVGETSKGRKGTTIGRVRQLLALVERDFVEGKIAGGLSSGEGLVWQVRDPITRQIPVKEDGKLTGEYEEVVEDPGVTDKRLLVIEGEFAQPLAVMRRPGNTLSIAIRNLWDHGTQGSLTKNSPARTTGAHIAMIGNISRDELRRELTATDTANGFANRFLFACSRRSKILPDGGALGDSDLEPVAARLLEAVKFAQRLWGPLDRDPEARALWHQIYADLSAGRPGLAGAATSRAEAQVMRIAVIYAVLDERTVIEREHLEAALAVWRYCEDSARYVFGSAIGDATADEILAAMTTRPEGMTRTAIRDLFGRNRDASRIGVALETLLSLGLARCEREESGGRPAERWYAREAAGEEATT